MNDEAWMRYAIREAETAFREGEVPVGAVVVKDGAIVASAHNRCEAENDPTLHAECIALKEAYRKLGGLDGCTLYVTAEPCAMCAGTMLNLRLPHLVFGAYAPVTGCCGSKIDLTDHWFDASTMTVGGVLERECETLLTRFFSDLRQK